MKRSLCDRNYNFLYSESYFGSQQQSMCDRLKLGTMCDRLKLGTMCDRLSVGTAPSENMGAVTVPDFQIVLT